jgi:hypothetical protein
MRMKRQHPGQPAALRRRRNRLPNHRLVADMDAIEHTQRQMQGHG